MIRGGWARPASFHTPAYAVELDAARTVTTGLWRGSWPTGDAVQPPSVRSHTEKPSPPDVDALAQRLIGHRTGGIAPAAGSDVPMQWLQSRLTCDAQRDRDTTADEVSGQAE